MIIRALPTVVTSASPAGWDHSPRAHRMRIEEVSALGMVVGPNRPGTLWWTARTERPMWM
jgi:hypothetical protein